MIARIPHLLGAGRSDAGEAIAIIVIGTQQPRLREARALNGVRDRDAASRNSSIRSDPLKPQPIAFDGGVADRLKAPQAGDDVDPGDQIAVRSGQ